MWFRSTQCRLTLEILTCSKNQAVIWKCVGWISVAGITACCNTTLQRIEKKLSVEFSSLFLFSPLLDAVECRTSPHCWLVREMTNIRIFENSIKCLLNVLLLIRSGSVCLALTVVGPLLKIAGDKVFFIGFRCKRLYLFDGV